MVSIESVEVYVDDEPDMRKAILPVLPYYQLVL
jgi:hypothetical protein